jgi:hypothetical protein
MSRYDERADKRDSGSRRCRRFCYVRDSKIVRTPQALTCVSLELREAELLI